MAEGRVPSTKNARTVDQRGAGTGPHASPKVDVGEGLRFSRLTDSPSKITGGEPEMSDKRRNEFTPAEVATPDQEKNAKTVKDTGFKTDRERSFAEWNRTMGPPLPGSEMNIPKPVYPSPLEKGTLGEISKGDKYAGTANKVLKSPKQAQ